MPIPGSPGIPFDWEILQADCPTLTQFANAIIKLAQHYDGIARDSKQDLSARTGAMIALMVLSKKYRMIEGMWKIRACKGELPGGMPAVVAEERWPPTWSY